MIVNNKYKVSWRHNNETTRVLYSFPELSEKIQEIIDTAPNRIESKDKINKLLQSQISMARSFSTCFIEDLDTNEIIEGIGIVRPGDAFDRKVGMYYSFKDCVSKFELRKTRRILWKQYLIEHPRDKKIEKVIKEKPITKPSKNENTSKYGLG